MYDLCLHTKFIEPLRQEIAESVTNSIPSFETMPLLDSFLKESSRLNPPEASKSALKYHLILRLTNSQVSIRRKVLSDFTFADGTRVGAGNWTCVPLRAMGLDNTRFPHARTFDAWRFVSSSSSKQRKFTEVDTSFPFWGFGKGAW